MYRVLSVQMAFFYRQKYGMRWKRKVIKGKANRREILFIVIVVSVSSLFIVIVVSVSLPQIKISGNEELFPSFPQRHNRINDLSFPWRREISRAASETNTLDWVWPFVTFVQSDCRILWSSIAVEGISRYLRFFTWKWLTRKGSISAC